MLFASSRAGNTGAAMSDSERGTVEEAGKMAETVAEGPGAVPPQPTAVVRPTFSLWLALGLLSLAVWIVFAHTLANDLVFDDLDTIKHNRAIEKLDNIGLLFSKDYFRASGEYTYRPVVTFSYFLDHALAGKRPWIYHLHNVVLHHANVLLVFALFSILGAGRWMAFASALLFALHPLQTEAVIFPGFREDLQMTLGMLAAGCLLARDRDRPSAANVIGAALALAYALFAKEGAALFPLAWLIFDIILDRRQGRLTPLGRRYAPMVLVLIAFVVVRFFLMTNPDAARMDVIDRLPLARRFLTAPYLFAYYVARFLWPTPLSIIHEIEALHRVGADFVLSAIVATAYLGVWIALSVRRPWLWIAGLWAVAAFAPVSNVYQIVNLWAERFYYSVNVGTSAIAAAGASAVWLAAWRRWAPPGSLAPKAAGWCLVGLLAWWAAVCDIARILECRTSLMLWRATVRCAPTNGVALKTLAKYELDARNFERAEQYAREAEHREGGGVFAANYILGESAYRQRDYERAIRHFEKARTVPPPSERTVVSLLLRLARSYVKVGRRDRAAESLHEALRWDPNNRAVLKMLEEIGKPHAPGPTGEPVPPSARPGTDTPGPQLR